MVTRCCTSVVSSFSSAIFIPSYLLNLICRFCSYYTFEAKRPVPKTSASRSPRALISTSIPSHFRCQPRMRDAGTMLMQSLLRSSIDCIAPTTGSDSTRTQRQFQFLFPLFLDSLCKLELNAHARDVFISFLWLYSLYNFTISISLYVPHVPV